MTERRTQQQEHLVQPLTQTDVHMVELLAQLQGVLPRTVIEIALHEWLEANFMRINSLHRNAKEIHNQLNSKT
tara:strand:+ start:1941 stop:2159 length:219 start_codon:yes stop_codon:yes gene_type:complete